MFRRWFELQGKMPLKVDRALGHIDRFVEIIFGVTIDDLDTQKVITTTTCSSGCAGSSC